MSEPISVSVEGEHIQIAGRTLDELAVELRTPAGRRRLLRAIRAAGKAGKWPGGRIKRAGAVVVPEMQSEITVAESLRAGEWEREAVRQAQAYAASRVMTARAGA